MDSIRHNLANYLMARSELEGELYLEPEVIKQVRQFFETLEAFEKRIKQCLKCALGKTRTNFVFGTGDPRAKLVFIGEAPGQEEDLQGEPFVGRAGRLLDQILESFSFKRQEVYICNILKCRPPGNRDPLPEEVASCEPYLWRQLELIQPRMIVALGRIAAQTLLKTQVPVGKLKEHIYSYRGIPLFITYHPAAILRTPSYRRTVDEDMRVIRKYYEEMVLS
jgi:DNA polymerase